MTEVIIFLAALASIIVIGFISEIIFRKTRIPDVLILLILGILIGSVFQLVDKNSFGFTASLFTTFTLIFLLFQGALNIEFKTLFKSLKGTLKLSVISFFITTLAVTLTALILLKFDILTSILIGTILSGTSSTVVIPILSNLKVKKRYSSILTLESAISDVFVIVFSITIISIIVEGNVSAATVFKNILSSFVLSLFIGSAFGLFWTFILTKSRELADAYMVTIAVIMALYAFVESPLVGSNGAIAVLAFGLMIGNSKTILKAFKKINKNKDNETIIERNVLSHSARNFYAEISFFVKVFFFVYLGIQFDFTKPLILFIGLIITIVIYLVRIPAVKLSFYKEKIDQKSESLLNYLVPKGLAAAVLAGLALESGIPRATELVNLVFSVVLISIIMTSVLIFLIGKQKQPIEKEEKEEEEHKGIFFGFPNYLKEKLTA